MIDQVAARPDRPARLAWAIGGLVATAILAVALPERLTFRGTLVILPLVVGLLASTHTGRGSAAFERIGLVGFLTAALAAPVLGLPGVDRAVAVFGLLLLVASLGRRLVAATRPSAMTGASVILLLALALYLAIMPWATSRRPPDGDEPWYLLITHSIAFDLDIDLANNYRDHDSLGFVDRALEPQPGDPSTASGRRFSRHGPLLPALLAPAYRIAGKEGALAMMALLAAVTVAVAWRLTGRLWPAESRARAAHIAVLAATPPFLLYSHQVWVEVPAALLTTIAFERILALETSPPDGERGRSRWWSLLVLAGALALLPLLKLRFGILSASLAVVALLRLRRSRWTAASVALGAVALGAAAVAVLNRSTSGSVLGLHSVRELMLNGTTPGALGVRLAGLFFDHAFGLFGASPLWLLLLPAALTVALGRNRRNLLLLRDLLIVALPYLVLIATRREWYGGWSPPFRYPLALLPALSTILVPLFARTSGARVRGIVAALSVATALWTLTWMALPGLAFSFADGRSRLLDRAMELSHQDLQRLAPSATRPSAAGWLLPTAGLVLLALIWPRRRRETQDDAAAAPVLLGLAAVLGGLAITPALAGSLPTGRIEVEAPWVIKTGGERDPEPWIVDRTRFREGWTLSEGSSAIAAVRAGGNRVRLSILARPILNRDQPIVLRLEAGDRVLAELTFDRHEQWTERHVGPLPWPAGASLIVTVPPPQGPPPRTINGIVVDRIELDWSTTTTEKE